ncbi:MAG: 30S ribosomal protein S4e [Candidatus Micrarchaeota archaeon]
MAKRGGTVHMKRLAAPKAIPLSDKKESKWLARPSPGPHPKNRCIPLAILLRDILHVTTNMREVKKVLANRLVLVDGVARTDEKFPVGLMDTISLVPDNKHYRIIVDWKGRLQPAEIKSEEVHRKIVKVINKHTTDGGKLVLTFHDGKNLFADNHIAVGDSVVLQLPKSKKEKAKLLSHIKLAAGAKCFISDGKHAGKVVSLKEIVKRVRRKSEAVVSDGSAEFITVSEYLIAVDKDFEVKA